jgi:integrase
MEETQKRERGSGSIFHNGSAVWWIKFYVRGIPKRESSKSTDINVAKKLLRRRLAEVEMKSFVMRTNVRIDELITDVFAEYKRERRKTLRDIKMRWEKHLQPFFTRMRADDLNSDLVQRYCARREAEGAIGPTINRELAVLKHAFHLAMKCTPPKVRSCPVFPMYKESDPRTGFLEDKEYEKLDSECDKVGLWLRALLAVSYNFAFRKGELLSMRVRQIDLANLTIRLEAGTTKNGKPRIVKMHKGSKVANLLTACVVGKQPDDYVFTRKKNKPVKGFRRIWKTVCEDAGRPDLLFHDLRRSGVRNLIRAGVHQSVAMKISGHRTTSVFDRYNIIDEADLAEAARKLDEKQKSNALALAGVTGDFGQHSGIVSPKSTTNEAAAHLNVTAAVLPN